MNVDGMLFDENIKNIFIFTVHIIKLSTLPHAMHFALTYTLFDMKTMIPSLQFSSTRLSTLFNFNHFETLYLRMSFCLLELGFIL